MGNLQRPPPRRSATPFLTMAACALLAACALPPTEPVARWVLPRAAPNVQAGCFSGQLGTEPWALWAAQAAVHLVGRHGSGTGFIVHDSADANDRHNRILTALHVADYRVIHGSAGDAATERPKASGANDSGTNGPGAKNSTAKDSTARAGAAQPAPADPAPDVLEAFAYDGTRIGDAEMVVGGRQDSERIADGRVLPLGDQVVMRIRRFAPGGEAAYAHIRGVDLAAAQPDRIVEGVFADPGGVEGGASGSAVVNEAGRVVGVLVRRDTISAGSASALWQVRQKVRGGTMAPAPGGDALEPAVKMVALPTRSWAFAEPLRDGRILAALGAAGFAVDTARRNESVMQVQAMGFPASTCIVYRGDMRANATVSVGQADLVGVPAP